MNEYLIQLQEVTVKVSTVKVKGDSSLQARMQLEAAIKAGELVQREMKEVREYIETAPLDKVGLSML